MDTLSFDELNLLIQLLPTKYVYRFCLTNKRHAQLLNDKKIYQEKFKIFKKYQKDKDPSPIRYLYYQSDVLGLNREIKTEIDKIPILMYKIRQILHKNPNTKFIIKYHDSNAIKYLHQNMDKHQISYANPSIPEFYSNTRMFELIKKFNAPNLELQAIVTRRPLDGIDLGDKQGDYPRYLFILAEGVDSLSMSARVCRYGNKSQGRVEVIHDNKLKRDFKLKPNQNMSFSHNDAQSVKNIKAVENAMKEYAKDCELFRERN